MMKNEKRLIDANEIEELFYNQINWGATDLMDAFDDALQDAQTVDAVEVVRCKNCKHWHHSGYCKLIGMAVDRGHNDYCSYGERKDND